ncbi:MAG TPA: hypothetical protein VGS16_04055 [Candidatus Dormibacteraeota bacterium]|nr:hypothetical protein [Candidatus Dormibacteraeota bacterium]
MQVSRLTRRRHIGPIGTIARVVIGILLLGNGLVGGTVVISHGQLRTGLEPPGMLLGVIAFPAVLLAWQWLRARSSTTRFEATGPFGTAINMAVFFALVLTPWYAPAFAFTSDAALVFYGASMLLAAFRGYGGCEVLAISNWVLGRDDQVGCFVLSPVDNMETCLGRTSSG